MRYLDITIEDHVIPQLLTSALEAYEIEHHSGRKRVDKLETFGLLWGYVISGREARNPHIVATVATVETSALRKNDAVTPAIDSLQMKVDFVRRYWPHLEVVGTFHSHPYDSIDQVRSCKGWEASTPEKVDGGGDTVFWPWIHEQIFPATPYLAHLIVTVASMKKNGWAIPRRIEEDSGYELSMGSRKIWMMSYGTEIASDERVNQGGEHDGEGNEYVMMDAPPTLNIPSLAMRIVQGG